MLRFDHYHIWHPIGSSISEVDVTKANKSPTVVRAKTNQLSSVVPMMQAGKQRMFIIYAFYIYKFVSTSLILGSLLCWFVGWIGTSRTVRHPPSCHQRSRSSQHLDEDFPNLPLQPKPNLGLASRVCWSLPDLRHPFFHPNPAKPTNFPLLHSQI